VGGAERDVAADRERHDACPESTVLLEAPAAELERSAAEGERRMAVLRVNRLGARL